MESQDLFQGPQAAREDEEEALSALSGGEDGAAGTISVVPSRDVDKLTVDEISGAGGVGWLTAILFWKMKIKETLGTWGMGLR